MLMVLIAIYILIVAVLPKHGMSKFAGKNCIFKQLNVKNTLIWLHTCKPYGKRRPKYNDAIMMIYDK